MWQRDDGSLVAAALQQGESVGIDVVVAHVAELIERPLVLYDTAMNVVAHSAHIGEVDDARRLTILSRRGTARATAMMRAHHAASAAGPLRLPSEEGMPERVVFPIRHDDHTVGYLVYVEPGASRDVPAPVRDLVDRHGAELARLLALRDLDDQESRLRLRVMLADLVSDDPTRRADAAGALVADEILPAVPEYAGLVIAVPGHADHPSTGLRSVLEAALVRLARSMPGTLAGAVIGSEAIAVLTQRGRLPDRAPDEAAGVRIGVGDAVPELAAVTSSVRQARIAVRASVRDPERYGSVTGWDALGLDRLLLQLPLEQLTLDDLPGSVGLLLHPTGGPDLAATLEAYLDCACDAQATARRLTIHRSTLYYRLDRIREVTGCDLHDGLTRRALHTGLRVARLAGMGGPGRYALGNRPGKGLVDGPSGIV